MFLDVHQGNTSHPALHRVATGVKVTTGSYWAKLFHPAPADTGKSQDGGNGAEPQHSAMPK